MPFITAPLDAENRPNAAVLSVEAAIARSANEHRPFTGGLYLGRHVDQDIYAAVPPAEAIATHVAARARRLLVCGNSGLDDCGVLYRMDSVFRESLQAGNRWAERVIPLLTAPRAREVAILLPAEIGLLEPVEVGEGGLHRMDLLAWCQRFTDLGRHVGVLHPDQVVAGALAGYRHLVVPADSLDDLGDNTALEAAVRTSSRPADVVPRPGLPAGARARSACGTRRCAVRRDQLA